MNAIFPHSYGLFRKVLLFSLRFSIDLLDRTHRKRRDSLLVTMLKWCISIFYATSVGLYFPTDNFCASMGRRRFARSFTFYCLSGLTPTERTSLWFAHWVHYPKSKSTNLLARRVLGNIGFVCRVLDVESKTISFMLALVACVDFFCREPLRHERSS